MERFRLDGKVALVTGAGSPTGIGFAAGRTLARARRARHHRLHHRSHPRPPARARRRGPQRRHRHRRPHLARRPPRRWRPRSRAGTAGSTSSSTTPASRRSASTRPSSVLARMAETDWDLDIALNLKTCFAMTRAVMPGHARAPRRPDRERLERHRAARVGADVGRLLGREGRRRRDDARPGDRGRPLRRDGELGRAGLDRDQLVATGRGRRRPRRRRSAGPAGRRRWPT